MRECFATESQDLDLVQASQSNAEIHVRPGVGARGTSSGEHERRHRIAEETFCFLAVAANDKLYDSASGLKQVSTAAVDYKVLTGCSRKCATKINKYNIVQIRGQILL
ncbi:hypothetical protein F2P81_009335 [Scophthalmus maximus]|uniref:Uncharacterized protein n=1 Tax=Scophthalmus maximus TaxID=52904 RepID=A0A6A4T6V4_SCOMX|nr:hypothetical protein F2P81_009335 [Scophthalmus maximus]